MVLGAIVIPAVVIAAVFKKILREIDICFILI
jgi:hypothetical protein